MEIFLFWIVMGAFGGWIFWKIWKDAQQQTMLFQPLAQKWKGEIDNSLLFIGSPTLVLPCCEYSVTVKSPRTGKKHPPIQTVASTTLTCSRPIRLTISQGFMNVTGLLSRNRRIKTGYQDFDRCFTTISTDERFAQGILSESVRQQLLHLSTHSSACRLYVTQNSFKMEIGHGGRNLQIYEQFIEGVLACLTQVDRCIRIRTIRFDNSLSTRPHTVSTLYNPDVSTLDIPPFGLENIVIHGGSYTFHHVERFITYAINSIGQKHLKQAVDVTVIGQITQLHPNLRNIFTNVCRRVVEREDLEGIQKCEH